MTTTSCWGRKYTAKIVSCVVLLTASIAVAVNPTEGRIKDYDIRSTRGAQLKATAEQKTASAKLTAKIHDARVRLPDGNPGAIHVTTISHFLTAPDPAVAAANAGQVNGADVYAPAKKFLRETEPCSGMTIPCSRQPWSNRMPLPRRAA